MAILTRQSGLGGPGVRPMALVVRQALIFLATLVLLLVAPLAGAPPVVALSLGVVFVIAGTVWVRGQYVDWLDGEPWLLAWPLTAIALGAGALMVITFFVLRLDGLGILGAVVLYLGAGESLARWRATSTSRATFGGILFGLGVTAVAGGFALLGRLSGKWNIVPLCLVAVGLIAMLPVAISLLSEEAIGLAREWDSRSRVLLGVVGGAIFVCMALAAFLLADSGWILGLFVLVGLLMTALASGTQADIVAVLGVLALMGVTPLQATEPSAFDPGGRSRVLVALGDSYMSGEGASIYYKGTDNGGVNTCRRSPSSWAAVAGQQEPFDGVAFLACSGARTKNIQVEGTAGVIPESQHDERGTQIGQYQKLQGEDGFSPALVVLNIGGNDAGFSTIGLMCVAPGNCADKSELWLNSLDQVDRALRGTYAEVREEFPQTPVVVTAYPDPIADPAGRCDQVALTTDERKFVTDFLRGLNGRIQNAARDYGFYYLDEMEHALATSHLQLCDPLNDGRPGLNFIGLRSVGGISEQRLNPANWAHNSLHPNERGHAAMLRVFQNWLTQVGPLSELPAESPTPETTLDVPDAAVERLPCDLFDVTPTGCRPQGEAWMARETGRLVLKGAPILAGAALGAWMMSVALFGWRRWRYLHWAQGVQGSELD